MKTPIQEFIDEVSKHRKELEVYVLEDLSSRKDLLFGVMQTLRDVESMLIRSYLQKEKEVIQRAYTDGIYEGCPIEEEDSTWQEWGSDYYNKTFNTKE